MSPAAYNFIASGRWILTNHSKLSNIVRIKGGKPVSLTIDALFPNPASTLINVLINAPNKDKATL